MKTKRVNIFQGTSFHTKVVLLTLLAVSFCTRSNFNQTTNDGFDQISSTNGYSFKTYNRATGLPSDYILCIYQDKSGYLWFGTDRGVSRFDGKTFTSLSAGGGLGNNFVMCIYQDKNNSMWFGMHEGGVAKYDGKTFITFTQAEGLIGKTVENIFEDKFGRLYFEVDEGICLYYRNKFSYLPLHRHSRLLTVLNSGSVLIEDSLNFLQIIPTDNNQFKLSKINLPKEAEGFFQPQFEPIGAIVRKNGNICLVGILGYLELSNVESGYPSLATKINGIAIESVTEDHDGSIWCGTQVQGILHLENNKKEIFSCVVKGGIQNRISSAFCDYEGNIWFGTMGSGVQKLLGTHLTLYDTKSGLTTDDVTTIYEDKGHRVWIGTRTGVSVIFNNKLINLENKLPNIKEVRCFTEDMNGALYIGTFRSLYGPATFKQLLGSSSIPWRYISYGISSLHFENKGNEKILWIATYGGGTHRASNRIDTIRIQDGIVSEMIESIVQGNNSVWFLSRNQGASKLINNKFENFAKKNFLQSNCVFSMFEQENDTTWFGTDAGLARVSHQSTKLFSFKDGLKGKIVWAIFPENKQNVQSNLWIVTDKCLNKFVNDTLFSFGGFNIFPSSEASINSVYHHTGSLSLWLATTIGAVKIDLSKARRNMLPPKIQITNAYADTTQFYQSSEYAEKPELQIALLNHQQNDIIITFAGLSFDDEQKVMYSFKLDGTDDNWSEPTEQRSIRYRNLNAGTYTFFVHAFNADGIRSLQPAKISFKITPPFWRTGWFIFFTTILLLSIFIGTIRYYSVRKLNKKIRQLEEEKHLHEERERTRAQIARDLHDDISSTLGSIALYSESFKREIRDLPENQKAVLYRISTLASEAVDRMGDIVWSVAPEHDTFQDMMTRMKNLMVELCSINRIEYEIKTDNLTNDVVLQEETRRNIYLIFKEALNNIIKHAKAKKVTFQLKLYENKFELIIEDDGKGFNDDFTFHSANNSDYENLLNLHHGHGIINMKKRADEIKAILVVESKKGSGSKIKLISTLHIKITK